MAKRGQAALEFLMTYGWAILAAVVVIAALVAFGVFRPGAALPPQCGNVGLIMTGLGCNDFKVSPTIVTLRLANGRGVDLNITRLNVSGSVHSCITTYTPEIEIADGDTGDLNVTGCTDKFGDVGDRFKGKITLDYREEGSTIEHSVTAILNSPVE